MTIPELLRREDYATEMIGKWHLGTGRHGRDGKTVNDTLGLENAWFMEEGSLKQISEVEQSLDFSRPVTEGPVHNGFDSYFGVDVPNFPPYARIVNNRVQGKNLVPKPETMFGTPGPMVPGWELEDILPRLSVEAARWITRQRKSGKPFFLNFFPPCFLRTDLILSDRNLCYPLFFWVIFIFYRKTLSGRK